MDVSYYLAQSYPPPPCWALVADVYQRERHQAVDGFAVISNGVREAARAMRLALHKDAHGFRRLAGPEDFAVVLMGKTPRLGLHHCGVAWAGKVLHTRADGMPVYEELASLRATYPLMEFWGKPAEGPLA